MAKCTCCSKNKNIVYKSYEAPFSINLCWDCLVRMDWQFEMKDIMPKLLSCSICRQKFIPKLNSKNKCSVCWQVELGYIKPKPQIKLPEIENAFDIADKMQRGICSYV